MVFSLHFHYTRNGQEYQYFQRFSALFIGYKHTLGTVAAAKYVCDHSIEAKQIWYTPVEATFSVEAKNAIAFIGEADPWSDVSKLKSMASECGIKMYSYPDGNHSLECGNIRKDIAVLEEVMEITESYVPVCRG